MTVPNPMAGTGGPGQYAERTDDKQPIRTPTGLPYGDAGALTEMQRQAPLPQQASPPPPTLSEPTQNPGQPVTAGAAAGPGPGPDVLGPPNPGLPAGGAVSQALARVAASDTSGVFARLLTIAAQKGL